MAARRRQPLVVVIAGPNGAGKTTFARRYLSETAGIVHFVNADFIPAGSSPIKPECEAAEVLATGRILRQDRVSAPGLGSRALRRVRARVRQGEHDAPRVDLERRFERGWQNFQSVYRTLADEWAVYDNPGPLPQLVEESA